MRSTLERGDIPRPSILLNRHSRLFGARYIIGRLLSFISDLFISGHYSRLFWYDHDHRYVRGCVQSCSDTDGCNSASKLQLLANLPVLGLTITHYWLTSCLLAGTKVVWNNWTWSVIMGISAAPDYQYKSKSCEDIFDIVGVLYVYKTRYLNNITIVDGD